MTTRTRALLLTSSALASSISYAQTVSQPPQDAGPQLEEIVVTAQKRPERLADIPASVSVVSNETVSSQNAGDIADLNKLVPSLDLNGSLNGRVPMGIRGISSVSNEGTVGLSSGVAILIDGVPVPSDSTYGNQLEDIQSIEVLKGPQATLGGRTAAAGVINMVTRGPSDTWTGDVSATATNDNEDRINGFITGPITQGLDFSLSAYGHQRDYPIKNIQLYKRDTQDASGARGKLLFKPNDNLDIQLMVNYALTRSEGANFVYAYLSPGTTLLVGTGGPPFLGQAALLPGITPSLSNQYYSSPIEASARAEDKDATLNVEYRFGELTFGSITAYQHEIQTNRQDLFTVASYFWNDLTGAPGSGTPPFYNVQELDENINQFSQEFKLASPTNQDFSYLVGAFYSDTRVRLQQTRNLLPAYDNVDITPDTATYDLYGRTTWKITPETWLVTGLRYNYDKLSYVDHQLLYTFSFPPPVILPNQNASDSSSSSTVVGDISLQQHFTPDWMGYATYARGYSPGAYNTTEAIDTTGTTTSPAKLPLVAKETVDNFEIGSKSTFLDHTLSLNVALFDTKYRNFQIQTFDETSTAINPPLILTAAGGAQTRGAELDTSWAATRRLRLDFSAAYIDAKFTDYPNAPCYYGTTTAAPGTPTCTQNLKDKPLPNSPRFRMNANVERSFPLPSIPYEVVFDANYSFRTDAQMLTDQNPQAIQASYGILNLNLGFNQSEGRYSVTAFVNNALNKHYDVDVEDFWSAPWGGTNTVIDQPARDSVRYYGVRLKASF
jgi:iron complex outermembrane receptor protein